MTTGFYRYQLRTKDISASKAFYDEVLGKEIWGENVLLSALPERAIAMGVPSHWLGHIAVKDVAATAASAVAAGAQALPPPQPGAALLRDPFGATLALSSPPNAPSPGEVKWHVLAARDQEAAFAWYSQLFGWSETGLMQVESSVDCRTFAWDNKDQSVGSTTNAARLPGVHPHWLFHFVVPDIAERVELVRRRGGKVVGPNRTPRGDLVAPCDDPQGAAFALIQLAAG